MTGSGRCHGPNCREKATDGPWCGTACQQAWDRQFHWLYGDGEVHEPVLVPAVEEPDEEQLDQALAAAVDAARADIERLTVVPSPQVERPASSLVEEIKAAYIQFADLPRQGPFKLTRWQRDALLDRGSTRWPDGTPMPLMGVPIEIVATVEESTVYHFKAVRIADACTPGAAKPLVASEDPQVAHSGERHWLTRLFDRLFGRGDA